jgi:hypothetical protein
MGFIAGDLILDLQDPIFIEFLVINVVTPNPSIIFGFDLTEGINIYKSVPRRIKWIRS